MNLSIDSTTLTNFTGRMEHHSSKGCSLVWCCDDMKAVAYDSHPIHTHPTSDCWAVFVTDPPAIRALTMNSLSESLRPFPLTVSLAMTGCWPLSCNVQCTCVGASKFVVSLHSFIQFFPLICHLSVPKLYKPIVSSYMCRTSKSDITHW